MGISSTFIKKCRFCVGGSVMAWKYKGFWGGFHKFASADPPKRLNFANYPPPTLVKNENHAFGATIATNHPHGPPKTKPLHIYTYIKSNWNHPPSSGAKRQKLHAILCFSGVGHENSIKNAFIFRHFADGPPPEGSKISCGKNGPILERSGGISAKKIDRVVDPRKINKEMGLRTGF
jgi:hypothetical protein